MSNALSSSHNRQPFGSLFAVASHGKPPHDNLTLSVRPAGCPYNLNLTFFHLDISVHTNMPRGVATRFLSLKASDAKGRGSKFCNQPIAQTDRDGPQRLLGASVPEL